MIPGTTALDALAERVAMGQAVSEADARLMLDTPDLIAVGVIADDVRRRAHGRRATFLRVFAIDTDAPPSPLPPATRAGEIRILGVPPSLEAALTAVRAAVGLAAAAPVMGFSLADLQTLDGGPLREVCARLRDAGLYGVSEVPIDRLTNPASAVQDARDAGLTVLRVTVDTLLPGERVIQIARARDLQGAVGGLLAFAPLPRVVSGSAPTTGYDDVKQIAAARVLATNIPSIQVDWVQYGPKLAQVALTMGADDVDGVSAFDPGLLGTRRSPLEEILRNIRAAGFEPSERDGRFGPSAASSNAVAVVDGGRA